ncbi:MAG: Ig-like domain-containing protein, partial [Hyphomicrobium sp.]
MFRDPDSSDILTFGVPVGSRPPGITFDPVTGVFSGTPEADASQGGPAGNGVYSIVVTASDGHGGITSTVVTFRFANEPPVAANDRAATQPGTSTVIDVLGNDRDGGMDGDVLTITAATSQGGGVEITEHGTLRFTPDPGFTGLATITYTISDGQGGTSTAQAIVLVTPNIHVTGPGMPDAPIQSSLPMPSSQISAAGAVVAAVEQSGALGSIGNTLGATGLIDATANQVSGLGGIGGTREGARVIHTDGREVHRIWQLNGVIDPSGSRHSYSWQPEGLTGFSLRHTFAEDAIGDGKAQVVLESLVRERTLIVRMTSTELPGHPTVVDYRVMQADGRPLPVWLDRVGPQVLMGERPANSEV